MTLVKGVKKRLTDRWLSVKKGFAVVGFVKASSWVCLVGLKRCVSRWGAHFRTCCFSSSAS